MISAVWLLISFDDVRIKILFIAVNNQYHTDTFQLKKTSLEHTNQSDFILNLQDHSAIGNCSCESDVLCCSCFSSSQTIQATLWITCRVLLPVQGLQRNYLPLALLVVASILVNGWRFVLNESLLNICSWVQLPLSKLKVHLNFPVLYRMDYTYCETGISCR